jgi:hypothetical protein
LQKDIGPALIECADDTPRVVVVSESPALLNKKQQPEFWSQFKECFSRLDAEEWKSCEATLDQWTRLLLEECHKKGLEPKKGLEKLSSVGTMGGFIGGITRGNVYNPDSKGKTHGLYWTHTVKCFLQDKQSLSVCEKVHDTKKRRKNDFRDAIAHCSKYLQNEIARANASPELIVGVGTTVACAKLKETDFKSVVCVYHPAAPMKKECKKRKLGSLCERVKELKLENCLPGCGQTRSKT